jgi:hypothetical protein
VAVGCIDCAYFRQADRWKNDHCLKQRKTLYCALARKDETLCGRSGRWFKDACTGEGGSVSNLDDALIRQTLIGALRGDRSLWGPVDPKANYRTLPVAICEAAADRLGTAPTLPALGEEELAALLLDADEFGNDEKARVLNEGWAARLLAAGKDQPHSGDCTKQPWTCIRCQRETWLSAARRVLARLSAQGEG